MRQQSITRSLYKFWAALAIGTALSLFVFQTQTFAQKTESFEQLKQKGKETLTNGNIIEAVTILEKALALNPNDAQTNFYYGFGLLARARTAKSETARVSDLNAGKKYLQKAKDLGLKDDLLDQLLETFNAAGTQEAQFSEIKVADDEMKLGEAAFVQGNFDEAVTHYQKAFTADPKLYAAPLFIGDMYVKKEDFAQAEIWYQKAIAIDPNRETAYRYSATPLMKQRKYDLARDRYIEAFISEPFNRLAVSGFSSWGEATNTSLTHPDIKIPAGVSKGANGNTVVTLGAGDGKDDGSFAWTAYALSRALWQSDKDGKLSDKFKHAYPSETVYRHSLAEETEGLKSVAAVIKEQNSQIKALDPSLKTLVELNDKGLLEAYVLLARPDRGIIEDYIEYRNKHRENLRRYVAEYVVAKNGN